MATYRVTVVEARGSISHFALRKSSEAGARREVERMRGGHWVSATLEIYDLSTSAWRATSVVWDWVEG